MELRAYTHVLALRETFQIARGAADEETVLALELTHDGITAYGEGAPVDYWGETPEAMAAALDADGAALLGDDLFAGEAIAARLARWDGPQGAKMALDGARHDWLGKRVGQPL
jgi:L-alanine-DL-glutamate epimerase-like enolase superfamily enzyme